MIDNFGVCNLFGKENYEYYARITRRVLNVEESWTFAFKYPSEELVPGESFNTNFFSKTDFDFGFYRLNCMLS